MPATITTKRFRTDPIFADHGPSQQHAEQVIAALEGGPEALTFASGIAACTAPFQALRAGDGVAVSRTIYHGVLTWLEIFRRGTWLAH